MIVDVVALSKVASSGTEKVSVRAVKETHLSTFLFRTIPTHNNDSKPRKSASRGSQKSELQPWTPKATSPTS